MRCVPADALVAGDASGEALVSREPLSLWGGLDPRTGEIVDRRHPLNGTRARGRVLIMPHSRGSSSSSVVLLEAIRSGNAPAAIIVGGNDTFVCLGALVAQEMYHRTVPVMRVSPTDLETFRSGEWVEVHRDGTLRVSSQRP